MDKKHRLIWSLESSRKIELIKDYLIDEWGETATNEFLNKLKVFENLVTRYPELYPASLKKP